MVAMLAGTLLVAVVPAFVPGAGDGERAFDGADPAPRRVRGASWPSRSSPPWSPAAGASCCRATRRRRTRSARPPTTSAPCCWLPSTPRGCSRPGCCWAVPPTASGPSWELVAAQVVVLLWLLVATSIAQVVAWTMEAVRRRRHGIVVMRTLSVALLGGRRVAPRCSDQLDSAAGPRPDRLAGGRRGRRLLLALGAHRSRSRSPSWSPRRSSVWCRPTSRRGVPPATSSGSRARPARPGRTRAPTSSRWSARTGPRCGARCRCGAACSCSPSAPAWSPSPATCRGTR